MPFGLVSMPIGHALHGHWACSTWSLGRWHGRWAGSMAMGQVNMAIGQMGMAIGHVAWPLGRCAWPLGRWLGRWLGEYGFWPGSISYAFCAE